MEKAKSTTRKLCILSIALVIILLFEYVTLVTPKESTLGMFTANAANSTDDLKTIKEKYKSFIKEHIYEIETMKDDYFSIDYLIFDMNKDGIPELVINDDYEKPYSNLKFYTIKDDEVLNINRIVLSEGEMDYWRSAIIYSYDTSKEQFCIQYMSVGSYGRYSSSILVWFDYNGNTITETESHEGDRSNLISLEYENCAKFRGELTSWYNYYVDQKQNVQQFPGIDFTIFDKYENPVNPNEESQNSDDISNEESSTIQESSIIKNDGEKQNINYDIYENADIYVADSIINGMYEKSTGKNSSTKLLQMSLDHKYTYNLLAESLCDDYVLSFNSMFWQNIEKTLSFDFISMANWKEMYYEIILMDYLTYSTEQSDFVDEFTLEASSRATDIMLDILQYQTENVTSDMSQLTDKLKGLSSSWAEEWAEEVDYIKKSDRDTEIFSKGLLNGVTTAYDFIENLSKYLTLKDCKDSTIAYLQKIKEQASGAGDEDLCNAIDSIVKKYNDSFATLVLKDTWEETYKQLSPIVFEGLIKDGIQKSPEVFAKVFGKITGKSTSEIKTLAEGLAEGSTESFDQIMIILKSETFALDLLFNSKDISDANLKLLEFYIISCYSNSAIRDLRDDFLNHKSKETARTFINGFFEYLHFQRYFTDYSYEFVSLSTKEGIWNKIKNYLFETKNEKLYDELTGYLDDDQSFNMKISEAANELYKTHSKMYGGLTIIDSETGISVSGKIEAGTTVEVVPILVVGVDGAEGYEITLVKNGKAIQPPEDVLVTIKSNAPNMFVYYVDENGNKIDMKAEYCDGCYIFRTNHFSKYVLASNDTFTVQENSNNFFLWWIIIGGSVLVMILIVVIIAAKKRKKS